MDFFDERDEEREREMEKVILENGMTLEIPEDVIEERIQLMGQDRDSTIDNIRRDANGFCLSFSESEQRDADFADKILAYIDRETATYR